MKILMTSSGGVIRGLNTPEYGLAQELVRLGHDVTVISSTSVMKKHDARAEEAVDGIKVKRFSPVLPSSLLYMMGNSFDLVHMHHLGYLAPISSYAAVRKKLKDMPAVFTIHGLFHDPYLVRDVEDPFSGRIKGKIQKGFPYAAPWRIINWLVHLPLCADRITALTEWEKREAGKLGIARKKIEVVPNGIILDRFRRRKLDFFENLGIDGEVLVFVGQPSRRKGWEYFLRAMPQILKHSPEAQAVFIGYRRNPEVERLCSKLGINDSVRFLGFLPEEKKIEALCAADVFVLPTLYEGFGIVFLEAMACGLPIVTTDVAGNSEIVENKKNGLLVKPRNSKAVADAAVRILSSSALRNRMKKNSMKKSREYDWKAVAKKYLEIYESVLK